MKIIKPILYFCLILLLSACTRDVNQEFVALKNNFDQQKSLYFSAQAQAIPLLQVFDSTRIEQIHNFIKKYSDSLAYIPVERLSAPHQKTYAQVEQFLATSETDFIKTERYHWDPSFYQTYPHFLETLNQKDIAFPDKLQKIESFLQILPDYYATAIQNIKQVSIVKIKPAKEDILKTYGLLNYGLSERIKAERLDLNSAPKLLAAKTEAILALKDYLAFCKSMEFEHGEPQSKIVFRDSLGDARTR